MGEITFVNGLSASAPHENAPSFVKARLSIKRDAMIDWLKAQPEWINADVKESRGGKWYCAVDDWKPDADYRSAPSPTVDDDFSDKVPF